MANSIPSPLAHAIQAAAAHYGVSPEVLTGIWRIESGSSYPNQFVNSSGYGGLFGTTKWNSPVDEQANYAASILANLIRTRGSLPAALSAYSGGGYSSVGGSSSAPTHYTGSAPAVSSPQPASQPAQPQQSNDWLDALQAILSAPSAAKPETPALNLPAPPVAAPVAQQAPRPPSQSAISYSALVNALQPHLNLL